LSGVRLTFVTEVEVLCILMLTFYYVAAVAAADILLFAATFANLLLARVYGNKNSIITGGNIVHMRDGMKIYVVVIPQYNSFFD
jgi:hypothetical protein